MTTPTLPDEVLEMVVSGSNSFHAGWLSWLLLLPFDPSRDESWREGWKMGSETGEMAALALRPAIQLGQIIVGARAVKKGEDGNDVSK